MRPPIALCEVLLQAKALTTFLLGAGTQAFRTYAEAVQAIASGAEHSELKRLIKSLLSMRGRDHSAAPPIVKKAAGYQLCFVRPNESYSYRGMSQP